MNFHRLSVKFFLADPTGLDPAAIAPVFHRWIQDRLVPGLLVDVADYRHVPDGPGVVLIGQEADYALDFSGGRPGLLYRRKRDMTGTPAQRIASAIEAARAACRLLESPPPVGASLRFAADEIELRLLDRLRAAPAEQPRLLAEIRAAAEAVLGGPAAVEPAAAHPRAPWTLRIRAVGAGAR
jgi:hypothetical protein